MSDSGAKAGDGKVEISTGLDDKQNQLLLVCLTVWCPPLGVFWKDKKCVKEVFICWICCFLYWPGICYAIWYIYVKK